MTTSQLRGVLGRSARAAWNLHREQVYAWERFFQAGLPEPPLSRHSASFRRWERELTPSR